METTTLLDQIVKEQNGYIRLIDAQNKGLSKHSVLEYVRQNHMERIAPGVYITNDTWEDRLYLLQIRNRNIVFSHETALFIHDLSDRDPFAPV